MRTVFGVMALALIVLPIGDVPGATKDDVQELGFGSARFVFSPCETSGDLFLLDVTNADDAITDDVLAGKRFIIMERDTKFCDAFGAMLSECGTKPSRLPPSSPNLNAPAYCARFVRSIKSECLEKMILFNECSLLRAATSFVDRYHEERNHQGLDNQLIDPTQDVGYADGTIQCRGRLGGILRYYFRQAT